MAKRKMNPLHQEFKLTANDAVRVGLDKQTNVLLLDATNYRHYRNGRGYKYYGGLAKQSPVVVSVPYAGQWHVVINLGGNSGRVSASVSII